VLVAQQAHSKTRKSPLQAVKLKLNDMKMRFNLIIALLAIPVLALTQESRQLAVGKPQAIADLKTTNGTSLLNAQWYLQPAHIVNKNFFSPGPQKGGGDALPLYPTGSAVQSNSLHPQVGADDFEKGFLPVNPDELEIRQGTGLLSFVWYKLDLTVPANIGKLNTDGTTVVFEVVVDDYSEIWVNGKQMVNLGQPGNGLVSGYNNRNRIVLTDDARAGEKFTIYILGMNGPIGKLPDNYIWIRNAVVDFYESGLPVSSAWKDIGKIYTIDESLSSIISPGTKIEKVADGFSFTEGPVWHPEGFLLFSDPNTNTIYRYEPKTHNVSIYMSHSGYTGADIGEYMQPGSNGLAIDKEGRLVINQHGNRRVVRIEKKGPVTVLADKADGKKLNSPNDLVIKSDGTVYFTDPPYGLPEFYNDPGKELGYQGVFMIKNGQVKVVSKDLGGPNGIAFSPDEKYLYVSNWDIREIHRTKTLWRYEVQSDGTLKNGKIFYDFNFTEGDEALDGIKTDREGNLFVSAPGGIWILNAEGKLLGKMVTPQRPANMAWGDDGKTLYLTAHESIYKIKVKTGGKFSWQ
jgi:gluconolactonase